MSTLHPIIEVKDLSKRYTLTHRESYETLRDTLVRIVTHPFRRGQRRTREDFWALRNVNFNIQPGERVGIIGRNGAGKSTLLKILSQITAPSEGVVILNGRVASLLEVGTGFHPELTGRENIYLNGAILGMKQTEIKKKFDEIVAFAEIEQFLDTPVKRYSSGMYVRLAFAVAAHLEPEILIVDEVLAVGDAQFQKKCLGKMQEVGQQGRTVLFVSHNMAAIQQLCDRVIMLENGKIAANGHTQDVINTYIAGASKRGGKVRLTDFALRKNSLAHSVMQWTAIEVTDAHGVAAEQIPYHEPFQVHVNIACTEAVKDVRLALAVQSALGYPIFNTLQTDTHLPEHFTPGQYRFTINIPQNVLAPGLYEISLGANGPGVVDWIPSATQFTVNPVSRDGKEFWENYRGGAISLPTTWTINT